LSCQFVGFRLALPNLRCTSSASGRVLSKRTTRSRIHL